MTVQIHEYKTSKGVTIRTGQRWRDNERRTDVRTLVIGPIDEPRDPARPDECTVYFTIVAVNGKPVAKRAQQTTAKRLTGSGFEYVDEGA